jgi:hypothetical protein
MKMKISERVREAGESLRGLKRYNPWERVLVVGWHISLGAGILLGLVATLGLLLLWGIALSLALGLTISDKNRGRPGSTPLQRPGSTSKNLS